MTKGCWVTSGIATHGDLTSHGENVVLWLAVIYTNYSHVCTLHTETPRPHSLTWAERQLSGRHPASALQPENLRIKALSPPKLSGGSQGTVAAQHQRCKCPLPLPLPNRFKSLLWVQDGLGLRSIIRTHWFICNIPNLLLVFKKLYCSFKLLLK